MAADIDCSAYLNTLLLLWQSFAAGGADKVSNRVTTSRVGIRQIARDDEFPLVKATGFP